MRLYKFIPMRYRDAFFVGGSLRLGTLFSYRNQEAHGSARGDANDGIYEQRLSDMVSFEHATLNFWMFCTSYTYSEASFLRWHDESPAEDRVDSCYEIMDGIKFKKAIQRRIARLIQGDLSGPVDYVDLPLAPGPLREMGPGLVKSRSEYGWQDEHRHIWYPNDIEGETPDRSALEALVIAVPEARRYCRPHSRIKNGRVRLDPT